MWSLAPGKDPVCLCAEGELTLEKLKDPDTLSHAEVVYLEFISPPNIRDLAVYQMKRRLSRERREMMFHGGSGRLARVGYLPRLLDALFSISLLARGRVPGDLATAAQMEYEQIQENNPHFKYYGRVLEQGGWVVLHYWYFYPFNNWRTGYHGANDHEADWEQVCIYLYRDGEKMIPEWIAYAMHELTGDDLRRRWDDPELVKVGEHPVVYVGAGSHASYFAEGEYLTQIEVGALSPVVGFWHQIRQIWQRFSRRNEPVDEFLTSQEGRSFFQVPFIDYARGDGLGIGPGESHSWEGPILLTGEESWVVNYRGLWGLYARDPIAGENAPAGPSFNRDGSQRKSWLDPISWAGLDKVLPPPAEIRMAENHINELQQEKHELDNEIVNQRHQLQSLSIEVSAVEAYPYLAKIKENLVQEIKVTSQRLDQIQFRAEQLENILPALRNYLEKLKSGQKGLPRAHIQRPVRPLLPDKLHVNRIAEAWAATSIGLLMISLILIILFARGSFILGLVSLIGGYIFIEAAFRGNINRLVTQYSSFMAVIASLVLVYKFFWAILVILVLVTGGYIMWENLRELWA
jgi:primosomal protein N''